MGEGAEDVEAPLSSVELAAGGTALRGEDEMRQKKTHEDLVRPQKKVAIDNGG